MRKTTIAVVEDDPRLRKAFEKAIAGSDDCRLTGMFATGTEALAGLPALAPDVILMDVNLPDTTGVECVAEIAPRLPETQILMVTVYQDPETTFRAIKAGAHGYLVKPVGPKKLLEAIREVRAGGVPMTRTIARKVLQSFRAADAEGSAANPPGEPQPKPDDTMLTPRERQVVELIVKGYSYKDVASQLGIAVGTVGVFVNRIYEKLHVNSRREIVEWSQQRGGRG